MYLKKKKTCCFKFLCNSTIAIYAARTGLSLYGKKKKQKTILLYFSAFHNLDIHFSYIDSFPL